MRALPRHKLGAHSNGRHRRVPVAGDRLWTRRPVACLTSQDPACLHACLTRGVNKSQHPSLWLWRLSAWLLLRHRHARGAAS